MHEKNPRMNDKSSSMLEEALKQLKNAIENKNIFKVTVITTALYKQELSKDFIIAAMRSKEPAIISAIAKKTPSKYFSRDILVEAIGMNDENVVKSIAPKTHYSYFDHDIIKRAISTKNSDIVSEIAKRCNRYDFDRDILDYALETKDPNIVRVTVDHVINKNIFEEYKEKIQKAILSGDDIKNFAAQILSHKNNESFDKEMQEAVLDIYLDVITKHFKKGDIPKNFPMKAFEDSISQSRYFFSNPEGVNFETLNQKDRFLILPIYTYGHAFSAVVKKLDESDKISVTFINLGGRPFEMFANGYQYREYVYKKEDALKVLNDHCFSVRLHYPEKTVTTDEAYRNFNSKALESYTVNVTSRDQKVGNCFLKNIEKGVRYALALGISKSENQAFSPTDLRNTNGSSSKLKVKFLKPLHLPEDRTNNLTTLQLRGELIKSLAEKFPEYTPQITEEWDFYAKRKITSRGRNPFIPEPMRMKTKNDSPVFEGLKTPPHHIALKASHSSNVLEKQPLSATMNSSKEPSSHDFAKRIQRFAGFGKNIALKNKQVSFNI